MEDVIETQCPYCGSTQSFFGSVHVCQRCGVRMARGADGTVTAVEQPGPIVAPGRSTAEAAGRRCPSCGAAVVYAGSSFCQRCGEPLRLSGTTVDAIYRRRNDPFRLLWEACIVIAIAVGVAAYQWSVLTNDAWGFTDDGQWGGLAYLYAIPLFNVALFVAGLVTWRASRDRPFERWGTVVALGLGTVPVLMIAAIVGFLTWNDASRLFG